MEREENIDRKEGIPHEQQQISEFSQNLIEAESNINADIIKNESNQPISDNNEIIGHSNEQQISQIEQEGAGYEQNQINKAQENEEESKNNRNLEGEINNSSHQWASDEIQRNLALGSVFGAFIGDALGSYIEFKKNISDKLLEQTLEMGGGGPFQLGPGQVTDDSELAMCMLRGLVEGNGKLDLDLIAKYYKEWICSHPFDIGNTTSNALGVYRNSAPTAKLCIDSSIRHNQNSQSNGSFMRCTPMAVFCRNLSDDEIRQAVTLESSMTHSNLDIQDAQVCYIKAIVSLFRYPGDRLRAYNEAKAMATRDNTRQWFRDVETGNPMKGNPNMGWVKIAFDHAFRHLIKNSDYYTAMAETLQLGGDTDTNAAIVGGLIGAAVGFNQLPNNKPASWKDKVMGYLFLTTNQGINRPWFLNQTEVKRQVESLFSMSPSRLEISPEGLFN